VVAALNNGNSTINNGRAERSTVVDPTQQSTVDNSQWILYHNDSGAIEAHPTVAVSWATTTEQQQQQQQQQQCPFFEGAEYKQQWHSTEQVILLLLIFCHDFRVSSMTQNYSRIYTRRVPCGI
jgi:hypothetical protein